MRCIISAACQPSQRREHNRREQHGRVGDTARMGSGSTHRGVRVRLVRGPPRLERRQRVVGQLAGALRLAELLAQLNQPAYARACAGACRHRSTLRRRRVRYPHPHHTYEQGCSWVVEVVVHACAHARSTHLPLLRTHCTRGTAHAHTHIQTHTFSLSLSLSLSHTHTHTHTPPQRPTFP
jgi:hypothetical protein